MRYNKLHIEKAFGIMDSIETLVRRLQEFDGSQFDMRIVPDEKYEKLWDALEEVSLSLWSYRVYASAQKEK